MRMRMRMRTHTRTRTRRNTKAKQQSRSSRTFRRRHSTRRLHGGEKKCLFIKWGNGIGLGNQLCVYAAATIIKNKLKNWDLCMPPPKHNPHTSTDYRFLFKQGRSVGGEEDINARMDAAILVHKNKNIRHGSWKNIDLVMNSGDPLENTTKNLRMKTTNEPEGGYYQNYGSIEPAIGAIREELMSELASRYESQVEDPETSAFIHIRHGDYHSNNMKASMDYYKAAKARLEQEKSIRTIYIISEPSGIDWANGEGLVKEEGKKLVTIDELDELKVLFMMGQCKAGACISPSTYSMWGAILGPGTNDRSVITYPSKWIHLSGKDLFFPERWIQI